MALTKVPMSMTDSPFVTVKSYGAKGDGVTDDSAAFQAATDTGKQVIIGKGKYVVKNVSYTGAVNWRGYGAVLLCDDVVLSVLSGSDSNIRGLKLMNITAPDIITRDLGTFAVIGSIRASNDPGYQPTINDQDIWATLTTAQQNQYIGPKIVFQGDATNVSVREITGRFVSLLLYDTAWSTVQDCNFRAGRTFGAGIQFWNINGQAGYSNAAINNRVTYASNSGIGFARNYDGMAQGNRIHACGESGIKTNQGILNGIDSRCYRMQIQDNNITQVLFDCIDIASDYPNTGTADSRHIVTGNDLYGANQTGIHADGKFNNISGNTIRGCGQAGIHSWLSESTVLGNHISFCNSRNTATGVHHILVNGDRNLISNNHIDTSGLNGSAIYANGANVCNGNYSKNGSFFWGNPGSVNSALSNNYDLTNIGLQTQSQRVRQNSAEVPALELYSDVGTVASTALNFKPRAHVLNNPIAQVRGQVTLGATNNEAGILVMSAASQGALYPGLIVQSDSAIPGKAWPVVMTPPAEIPPQWLQPGSIAFALDETGNRLVCSVRYSNGTTNKKFYIPLV